MNDSIIVVTAIGLEAIGLMHVYNCIIENMEKGNINIKKTAFWAAIGVVIFWSATFLLYCFIKCPNDRGTFGDMFGAVNALFSGFAFAGVILTLIMQHNELKFQREEIEEKKFEDSFFQKLSLQQRIVDNLTFIPYDGADTTPETKGSSIFKLFYNDKVVQFKYIGGDGPIYGVKDLIMKRNSFREYRATSDIEILDGYFRHLYKIFKYIDDSSLKDSEKYEYASIARDHLSDYELLMLFYHALTVDDNSEFKKIIEKYAIFNNLKREKLAKDEDYNLYEKSAYKH